MSKLDIPARQWFTVRDLMIELIGDQLLTSREIEAGLMRASRLKTLGAKGVLAIRATLKHLCEEGVFFSENAAEFFGTEHRRFGQTEVHFANLNFKENIPIADATAKMLYRYVETYGPVTLQDAAWWSGLSPLAVEKAVNQLADAIVRVELRDCTQPMLMSRDRVAELADFHPKPVRDVKFIAHEESLLKAYFETRNRFISTEHYNMLFNQIGEARSCVLVDGRLTATWLWKTRKNAIDVQFFETPAPSEARRIAEEAEAVRRAIMVPGAQSLPLFKSSAFEYETSLTRSGAYRSDSIS